MITDAEDEVIVILTGDVAREESPAVRPGEWDILKSIVYGGLIESITSLAVVSSAAGAGAATCMYPNFVH